MARLPAKMVSRLLHLRDPARRIAFMRFLLRRFWDDNLFEAAGSLAYTTVFALVPPLWRRIMDPRALRARSATVHLEDA